MRSTYKAAMTEGTAQKFDVKAMLDSIDARYREMKEADTLVLGDDEWQRISKALRLASAWLEADATVDREIERELLERDYVKSKAVYQEAERAREAFRQALEGSPE